MEECNERRDYTPKCVFVGSVSGGLAGRGCERKGPGRKAGEDRHEVSYPPEADHHKASSAAG